LKKDINEWIKKVLFGTIRKKEQAKVDKFLSRFRLRCEDWALNYLFSDFILF
jgi:hypothetical protein